MKSSLIIVVLLSLIENLLLNEALCYVPVDRGAAGQVTPKRTWSKTYEKSA